MLEVAVYNRDGQQIETLKVDEAVFGGVVRPALLKQAIVMYHQNRRVGTAVTKNKSLVEGSTRKLYRQKGTGNARMGQIRTPIRKGGGVAFAKYARDFSQTMPKKQRRLACASALLAKLQAGKVKVIDQLSFQQPKTKEMAKILSNLKIDRSCLVAIETLDQNIYKSARNIPKVDVLPVKDLNAWALLSKQQVLFTKQAFVGLLNRKAN